VSGLRGGSERVDDYESGVRPARAELQFRLGVAPLHPTQRDGKIVGHRYCAIGNCIGDCGEEREHLVEFIGALLCVRLFFELSVQDAPPGAYGDHHFGNLRG
jgi:hypothetical protein